MLYLESSLNTKASKFEEIYLDAKLKLALINEDLYDESFYKTELNRPRNFLSSAKIKYYYAANQLQKGNTAFASLLFKEALKLNQNDDKLNEKVYEQLYSLNLSDKEYSIANNYLDSVIDSPFPELNSEMFIQFYNTDQLGGMIRNLDVWLKDIFEQFKGYKD